MDATAVVTGGQVGDLRIEDELGRGAFGVVYRARDTLLQRPVALKLVRTPSGDLGEQQRRLALREARLVAGLNSPHIVTLYRVHPLTDQSGWVFEMEYVEGGSLQELLRRDTTFTVDRAISIVDDIVSALKAAHEQHVVHGDVKPANILLTTDGKAKLADFGLARLMGDGNLSTSSAALPMGTPEYMAPEIVMGGSARRRSDIWSVGVLLYRMLAGRMPFEQSELLSLFQSIESATPAPLTEIGLPERLADIVSDCLRKRVEDRPANCGAIRAVLRGDFAPHEMAHTAPPAPRQLRGRSTEIGRIRELLNLSRVERPAVLVTGDAGIGKSRIVKTLLAEAWAGTRLIVRVSASRSRGLLEGILLGIKRAQKKQKGAARNNSTPAETPALLQRLLDKGPGDLGPKDRRSAFWAIEEYLIASKGSNETILVVEDAQFLPRADLAVLKAMARKLPAAGVSFVIVYRSHAPSLDPQDGSPAGDRVLAAADGIEEVAIGPLGAEELFAILEDDTRDARLSPTVAQRVVRFANGNPLFGRSLLRHLRETKAVVVDGSGLRESGKWQGTGLPARLKGLAEQRIEALHKRQRMLLDVAAVDGVDFDGEALAAVLELPLLSVLRDLQHIYRETGLIEARQQGFRFSHPVLQEVLYDALAPDLRRAMHRQLATHLERRGDGVDPSRLGNHWEYAGERERALPHLLAAARRATEHHSYLSALDLSERAGLRPDSIDEERAHKHSELLLALTSCYRHLARHDEAGRILDAVERSAEHHHEWRLALRARVRRAQVRSSLQAQSTLDLDLLRRAAKLLPTCSEREIAKNLLADREHAASQ
ncbi:MAG: protein kinase [Planctomycetota bacterium]